MVELTAGPLPGEVSDINNHAVVTINGVRDRLRVLLVSGEPHAGERTWRRLLKADPAVDLVHFTILRPPEKDDLTPLNELALIAFPVRELFQVKINEFDLIILDRFSNRGILPAPYLRNIADYVRNGGALLLSVGPEFSGPTSLAYTPLAPVLPAEPLSGSAGTIDGPFRPRVTALGERHPVTAGLPGDRLGGRPGLGGMVSPAAAVRLARAGRDERARRAAAAGAGPGGPGPRGAAAVGPDLAVVTGPRRRRAAGRAAAPGRALADEGAGAGGGGAHRDDGWRQPVGRAAQHGGDAAAAGHGDVPGRPGDEPGAARHGAGPRRRLGRGR